MNWKEVKINSGGNQLDGTICNAEAPKGGVVFIAGGGSYTKELYREWQEQLADNDYSSLAFDFPSIGKSTGELSATSLNSRLADTENALVFFESQTGINDTQITLCGRSMGGPLSLRIAGNRKHKKVILLYPAAYSGEAYDKNFGDALSNVIRKESSWVDSPDFVSAKSFEGQLLVIYGQFDEVIPKGIQERYLEIGKQKGQSIVLQGAGHNKFLWDNDAESSKRRHELFEATLKFLEQ